MKWALLPDPQGHIPLRQRTQKKSEQETQALEGRCPKPRFLLGGHCALQSTSWRALLTTLKAFDGTINRPTSLHQYPQKIIDRGIYGALPKHHAAASDVFFLTDPSQWALGWRGSALLSHLTDEVSKGLGWLARSHTSVLEPLSFKVDTLTVESVPSASWLCCLSSSVWRFLTLG